MNDSAAYAAARQAHTDAAVLSATDTSPDFALAPGTRVNEFEILDIVGEGGFGIVYRARDHSLQRIVALKEYMPAVLAARSEGRRVSVRSPEHVDTFLAGLRSFINEARLLAQFDHPSLVKVFRVCEAFGTAYMVMPLYEGVTLKQALRARAARGEPPPPEGWLRAVLDPLLDVLDVLHRAQCLHRDIAPDNILLLGGDRMPPEPLLLDFGAARRVLGGEAQALTVILKPGYAPVEQYDETAGLRQGPWTDIYALAAVIHAAMTGKPPVPAVTRLLHDERVPLAQIPALAQRYSPGLLAAVDHALAPRPEARPQEVAAWRAMLRLRVPAAVPVPDSDVVADPSTAEPPAPESAMPAGLEPAEAPPRTAWKVGAALACLLAAFVLVGLERRDAAPVPAPPLAEIEPPRTAAALPATTPEAGVQDPGAQTATVPDASPPADGAETTDATARTREALREARQCLVARRYACTIQRGEEVLKSQPGHPIATRLVRLAEEQQAAAVGGGRDMRSHAP